MNEKKIARVQRYKVSGVEYDWKITGKVITHFHFLDDGSSEKPIEFLEVALGIGRDEYTDVESVDGGWEIFHEPDRKPLGKIELLPYSGMDIFVDGQEVAF